MLRIAQLCQNEAAVNVDDAADRHNGGMQVCVRCMRNRCGVPSGAVRPKPAPVHSTVGVYKFGSSKLKVDVSKVDSPQQLHSDASAMITSRR